MVYFIRLQPFPRHKAGDRSQTPVTGNAGALPECPEEVGEFTSHRIGLFLPSRLVCKTLHHVGRLSIASMGQSTRFGEPEGMLAQPYAVIGTGGVKMTMHECCEYVSLLSLGQIAAGNEYQESP